jgi:CMP-N,N'-diacetyllegionaminic acid synthase
VINGKRVLAVIPARGGSKRAPMKNIADFRGKPLLAWSIEVARQSKYIDLTIVSSEDLRILMVAEDWNCAAVFRPAHLAEDTAANEDVLRHVLTLYPSYDWIVLLQPTSPLRIAEDIDTCLELAQEDGDGCISYRENGSKNGAVYVMHAMHLEHGRDFKMKFRQFYVMPERRSLDIDYLEEFYL